MSEPDSGPTQTALAAEALLERIGSSTYLRVLRNSAVLAGWSGARQAGLWDTRQSDAVAIAALHGILGLLSSWAAETDPEAVRITCRTCGRTSHNRHDAGEGYCSYCHDWTGEPSFPARW